MNLTKTELRELSLLLSFNKPMYFGYRIFQLEEKKDADPRKDRDSYFRTIEQIEEEHKRIKKQEQKQKTYSYKQPKEEKLKHHKTKAKKFKGGEGSTLREGI